MSTQARMKAHGRPLTSKILTFNEVCMNIYAGTASKDKSSSDSGF